MADTRTGSGFPSGYGSPSIGGGVSRDFTIAGQCGIPADAQAVSFNFTVWNTTSFGDLRVFPAGGVTLTTSTLNWNPGVLAIANAAVVALGTGGAITVVNEGSGTIDLFFDVNGYYSPQGVVNSVNSLSGNVTLSPGSNVAITPSGNTLIISNVGTLTGITAGTGIAVSGSAPTPTVLIPPAGILADRIASAQVVKDVNGVKDSVSLQGTGTTSVTTAGSTITIGAPSGSMILGAPGDTTLIGAGYTEASSTSIYFWTATATAGAPLARSRHTAIWTGTKMIVWGGSSAFDQGNPQNTGGQYDPAANSWVATSIAGAPSRRESHTAVWTGSRMIVWGGDRVELGVLNDGGQYDPGVDAWTPTTTTGAPSGRTLHSAVWTGSKMVVWGGAFLTNTGGLYDPLADSWSATSTSGAPSARQSHTAVWTGSKMIVWGGFDSDDLNSGGQYDPVADSWTATTSVGAPPARSFHTAVWSGSKMIVWGGLGTSPGVPLVDLCDGGVYDPGADSWKATNTTGAPSARVDHTAVWTGSKMIVWGGINTSQALGYLNTGGQYDLAGDYWTATSTTGAPSRRGSHTAVWTGSRMIVWGGSPDTNTGGQWLPVSLYLKN